MTQTLSLSARNGNGVFAGRIHEGKGGYGFVRGPVCKASVSLLSFRVDKP